MKKVGILGSGMVAKVLGAGFIKHGFEVMLGTRDLSKLAEWQSKNSSAKTGSFEEAAAFGEIVVLAAKGHAAKSVLELAKASNLNGKTVIDATNPIKETGPVNGVLPYFSEINHSFMEQLQEAFPDAHFVKAFSCVGNSFMVNPDFGGIKPSMFICGNSEEAKHEVKHILDLFGWEVEDMGKVEAARAIEPLCILWCIPGFLNNQWMHAFKLLKK